MGVYSEGLGRYLDKDDVTLKVSGSESGTTTHAAVEIGDRGTLYGEVVVTVAPTTLIIAIEGSNDNSNWTEVCRIGSDGYRLGTLGTAPANITGTGTFRFVCPAFRYMRSKSTTLTGTPTYSIGGSSY